MPSEQQDRFAEPRGTQCGDRARATRPFEESNQSRRCFASLLDAGPTQVSHHRRYRGAQLSLELSRHRGPAMERRARWRITRCTPCAMAIQLLEVEHACPEAEDPTLDCPSGDADACGDAGRRPPVSERVTHRIQDDLDAGDLAGQRIPGQHALTVSAAAAARQRHSKHDERVARLEPPFDSTASQLESALVTRSARGTSTAGKKLIAGIVDGRGVAARLDVEYEDHVLMTAPG